MIAFKKCCFFWNIQISPLSHYFQSMLIQFCSFWFHVLLSNQGTSGEQITILHTSTMKFCSLLSDKNIFFINFPYFQTVTQPGTGGFSILNGNLGSGLAPWPTLGTSAKFVITLAAVEAWRIARLSVWARLLISWHGFGRGTPTPTRRRKTGPR